MQAHLRVDARLYAVIAILGIAFQINASAAQPAGKAWDAYTQEFVEATFKARPQWAVWAGRHEFDGRLPDWSAAGIRSEIERLHIARKGAVVDAQVAGREQPALWQHGIARAREQEP